MSQIRFNQAFIGLVAGGVLGSFLIPPSITDRAKGKVDLLLVPVVRPVRAIAGMFHSKWGDKSLPPGETVQRTDAQLSAENVDLRQQVVFLNRQLEDLRLVEAERKRLGKLLDYFKPVMCPDGLVGRLVEGRRVRLITDKDFIIVGQFGRWENGAWVPVPTPKPSVKGMGRGVMQVVNLTLKDTEKVKPGDWVIISDTTDYPDILQGRKIGQVESVRALPGKALFAEIIVKPSTDLRQLQEVLVMRK